MPRTEEQERIATRYRIISLQLAHEALLAAARAEIIAGGYDHDYDEEAVRLSCEELLDPKSEHGGDVTSIASHFGLYT